MSAHDAPFFAEHDLPPAAVPADDSGAAENMISRMPIVLISLYSTDAIGLRYLAGVLENHGFRVSIVFFKELYLTADLMTLPTEKEYIILIDLLKKLAPGLVGISLRSAYSRIAASITEHIKREASIPVIWGGTHPTIEPEECLGQADMVCIGEGEYPLLELAERLSVGADYASVPNLWIRRDGRIIKNDVRPLILDLDSLPFPVYGDEDKYLIENEAVMAADPALRTYNLNILASRGCPYHCAYCCNSLLRQISGGQGSWVRRRSVDNVMQEILRLKDRFPNLKRIDFIDEVFAWDRTWTASFIKRYQQEVRLPFQCAQHPLMVDREILTMLKNAGLERVEIGVQSGSEHIRKDYFERPVSDEKILEASRLMTSMGIVPFYDVIVDNPFETERDRKDGLDLLLRLSRPFHLHLFSLKYFPHTATTRRALAAGMISADRVEGRGPETSHRMFVTLNDPRPASDRFWISMYSLVSKSFIPRCVIRWLSRRRFLSRNPAPLLLIASVANTLKLGIIALGWLFQGKPVFSTLRHTSRRKTSPII